MSANFSMLLLGCLSITPALAQQIPDTTRTGVPPAAAPVPAAQPAPAPRLDVTDPKTPLQAPVYVPLTPDAYRLIDRYAIKYGPDSLGDPHTSNRPLNRAAVARLAERAAQDSTASGLPNSRADRFNLRYLQQDNWQYLTGAGAQAPAVSRRPVLRHFYRTPTDLYSVNTRDFQLRVNPVVHFEAGQGDGGLLFVNTRGAQVEGVIDQRLGFFTYFTDTQMRVPQYVSDRVARDNAVPNEGYWKPYKNQQNPFDFLTARGYVTYAATRHINVQLGHDRNFIGNGFRSLILSDFSAPYFFLKLNTRLWKLNYQNIFAELTTERTRSPSAGGNIDTVFQKKYMALHHLSYDITPTLNVGLFETVMFGRRQGHFELQYLNPIIFYRSVEQAVGSNDNAVLGADFRWNIRRRGQLYGQVVLDELIVGQVRSGRGWWGNKQAFQLGAKYLDAFGLRNLDLQGELNYIRPFTYQHIDLFRAYEHYGQPLAHPMGANLREVFGQITYQPLPRLTLIGRGFYAQQGLDFDDTTPGTNLGSNVLRSYNDRPRDAAGGLEAYGYRTAAGRRYNLLHAEFTATWQARPNLWLDARVLSRNSNLFGSATYPSVALRWNAAPRRFEF